MFVFIIFTIVIYILLLFIQPFRFYRWYPSISIYPNNNKEIEIIIKDYISKRTINDIDFFRLTDPSPLNAFRKEITENQFNKLNELITSPLIIKKILFYKNLYNRARPSQVNPNIDILYSKTANTASYPSGHAFQAYLAAKYLSKWEPLQTKKWYKIADRVADIRIIAGLHYPSDRDFAKHLVNNLKIYD